MTPIDLMTCNRYTNFPMPQCFLLNTDCAVCCQRANFLRKKERYFSKIPYTSNSARIAQLVEQLICNHQVGGSNPSAGSNLIQFNWKFGRVN